MEEGGAAPACPPDGKVGGNGSCLLPRDNATPLYILSKTGKYPGKMDVEKDFCIVESFDCDAWSASYYSVSEDIRPTSDTPMHYSVYNMQDRAQWSDWPQAALHGHALETVEKAQEANIPCSKEETLFSTPPDTEALIKLLEKYPYPENNIFVRKNHGFFILGKDIKETVTVFNTKVLPFSQK